MDDNALIELVRNFAREMNALQLKYFSLLDQANGNVSAVYRNYHAEADKLYTRYLTAKKRSCYYGISSPPHFAEINEKALATVEEARGAKVVTFLTQDGCLDFQFRVVFRKGNWLIDSYKQRYRSPDREVVYQWQYGSF